MGADAGTNKPSKSTNKWSHHFRLRASEYRGYANDARARGDADAGAFWDRSAQNFEDGANRMEQGSKEAKDGGQ